MRVSYSTQVNVKPTIFKFYTPFEFFIGLMTMTGPALLAVIFDLPPGLLDSVFVFGVYSLVIVYFKTGKPEGYLIHCLQHLFSVKQLRAGHKLATYPIRPDEKVRHSLFKQSSSDMYAELKFKESVLGKEGVFVLRQSTSHPYVFLGESSGDALLDKYKSAIPVVLLDDDIEFKLKELRIATANNVFSGVRQQ